jgi:hypothetical protein
MPFAVAIIAAEPGLRLGGDFLPAESTIADVTTSP